MKRTGEMHNGVRIRFWGGLRTIGGTIITVEYGGFRIVLDFGTVIGGQSEILNCGVNLSGDSRFARLLKLGVLKPVNGVYSAEDIAGYGIEPAMKDGKTAVFISHMHIDHMGAAAFLSPDIPVYMTRESKLLLEAIRLTEGAPDKDTQICAVEAMKPVKIGEMVVTPVYTDHDVQGACAFHIATPEGGLLYTGDIRLHGLHPEKTLNMAETGKSLGTDVLFIEGTTLGNTGKEIESGGANAETPETVAEEGMIPQIAGRFCERTSGIVIANLYSRNTERIAGLLQAAKSCGRVLVLDEKTAVIMNRMYGRCDFSVFENEAEGADCSGLLPDGIRFTSLEEINLAPGRYILQNDFVNILDLLDLQLENGLYLHMGGIPLGDYDPRYGHFIDFLNMTGINFHQINCGGHAFPPNLRYLAEKIGAGVVVPLHSLHPELLGLSKGHQLLPEYGSCYTLSNHRIYENSEQGTVK